MFCCSCLVQACWLMNVELSLDIHQPRPPSKLLPPDNLYVSKSIKNYMSF